MLQEVVEDATAATLELEWSTMLLRSFLMEAAGFSMLDAAAAAAPLALESSFRQAAAGISIFDQCPLAPPAGATTPPPPPSSFSSASSDLHVDTPDPDDDVVDDALRLDARLWRSLPPKLLERILALLPLPSFFRLRLVCKTWYRLLFSDSFLEVCAKVAPPRPWFLLFRPGDCSHAFALDPLAKSWLLLPLAPFLPPCFTVVASAGGLLCCISEAAGRKTILVCNPVTRACVQLPSTIKERFVPTVGLVFDPRLNSYRVMAAGDDLISRFAVKNLTTELYDSRCQYWRMTAPLPRLCNLESGKTTYANGYFYCMNYSPFSVLAYDTEQGVWSKIQAPMRRFLRTPNLVECRGRLVLVAAVEKNKLNVPKSIRMWGLQNSKTGWVELERMPQSLYEEFMRVSGEKAFNCIGHGNLILITLNDTPEMLMYDLYEKVWRWAPRCPFLSPSADGRHGFHAFAFDPRLETSVC